MVTTGQTLTTNINTVSTNLISTGKVVDDISGNLITTGQTLQTQITSNDTDITNLSSNLVTTGQTLTTNINTVATNLVTTGQTLTSEIATVSGLIPATVIDGGGTANKVPLWSDANTIGDSVISQSSSKIGIGTATPSAPLHVAVDGTSEILLERTTNIAGMPSQIRIKSVGSEWSLANNLAGNGKLSIRDVTDSRHVMVFDGEGVVTTNKLEPLNGNDSGYLGSSSKKWKQVYFGILEADTATFSGAVTANAGLNIDNINIDGTTIALSSADLTLDVAGDIILDADGGDLIFMDGAGDRGRLIFNAANPELILKSQIPNADIKFEGNHGGVGHVTALTLDMSDAGTAIFNHDIKLADNGKAIFGNSSDLQIYHSGADSYIVDSGAGDLYIRTSNELRLQDSTGTDNFLYALEGGDVRLYYDGAQKLATASTGVTVTGLLTSTTATFSGNITQTTGDLLYSGGINWDIKHTGASQNIVFSTTPSGGSATERVRITHDGNLSFLNDSSRIKMGLGADLQIYHDGSQSIISDTGTGNLNLEGDARIVLRSTGGTENYLQAYKDGQVELYYNNAVKLATTSTGITVTGAGTFSTSLKATTILDASNSAGTSGQILTSTGSALDWKTLGEISGVDGTGTAGYLSKWTDADTIGNSVIVESSSKIGIGTTTPDNLLTLRSASQYQQDLKFTVGSTAVAGGFIGAGGASENIWMSAGAELTANSQSASGFTARNNEGGGAGKAAGIRLGDSAGTITFFTASSLTNGNTFTWDGGSETGAVMSILNDGKVGIGTTAPAYKLQIHESTSGTNYIQLTNSTTGSGSGDGLLVGVNAAEDAIFWNLENTAIRFATNGADRLAIASDGKVGIGTTAPSNALDVQGGTTNTAIVARSTDAKAQISLVDNSTTSVGSVVIGAEGDDLFLAAGSGGAEALRIKSDGNVGIGTDAPGSKLDVIGTTTVRYAAGNFSTKRLDIQAANTSNLIQSVTNPLHIYDNSAIRICMLQGGSVGIGTAAPDNPLEVFGADSGIKISSASSNRPHLRFECGTAEKMRLSANSAYGAIGDSSDANRYMVFKDGKVGVGTTAPARLLHVYNNTASTASEIKIENAIAGYNAALQIKTTVSEWDIGSNILAAAGSFEVYERTGGSAGNRLTILSGGKVGIGTTAPTAMLDVRRGDTSGKVAEFHQSAGYGIDIGSSQADAYISSGYVQNLIIKTNPGSGQVERIRIDKDGKVGIGVTAPVAKLHIDDSATGDNKGLYIQNTHNVDGDSAAIRFGFAGNDNANKGGIFFKRTANYGRGSLIFATENTQTNDNVDASDAKLTISADGKVDLILNRHRRSHHTRLNVTGYRAKCCW